MAVFEHTNVQQGLQQLIGVLLTVNHTSTCFPAALPSSQNNPIDYYTASFRHIGFYHVQLFSGSSDRLWLVPPA